MNLTTPQHVFYTPGNTPQYSANIQPLNTNIPNQTSDLDEMAHDLSGNNSGTAEYQYTSLGVNNLNDLFLKNEKIIKSDNFDKIYLDSYNCLLLIKSGDINDS